MTAIQICALFVLVLLVGLTYWAGYRGGLIDGRIEGIAEGKAIEQSDCSVKILNLELLLDQARDEHKNLFNHYKRALAASKLGETERQTLLEIAEKLRIAAETFSAFRTGKKLERDTIALRDQALAMAALLDPATQLDLSKESEPGDGSIHTSFEDAKKASLFFQQLHLKNRYQKMVGGEA